ncbi:Flp pilus assembly protein CpaB [Cupriavidus sp. 2TAF22]|uniref:Flp pilus assembly protein CpaB n=1 Tax=unclassified Cupriavidus TaxID=2640874 RepID=UPI003F93E1D1
MRNVRAIVMLLVAALAGLAAVVLASRWMIEQSSGSVTKVLVAGTDINLGQRLAPEFVKVVDWPRESLPPGALTDQKLIDGRVTKASVMRGEPILESKLTPVGTRGGLSAVIAEGKRAITVRVNDVVGVAGFALPGSFVDIIVNTQKDQAKNEGASQTEQSISKIVLEKILVLAIAQEVNRDETKPKVVNAVTLEVSPDEAEKLDLARSVGTLSLVLRNQIDPRPVETAGATKRSLLNEPVLKAAVTAAPVAKVVQVVQRIAEKKVSRNCVGVISGMQQNQECF